jgi:hypothetical protein
LVSDFDGILRHGQTIRETVRRFGFPYWIGTRYAYVEVGYLLMEYNDDQMAQHSMLVLSFDSTNGLQSACINRTVNCLTLLPK